MANLDKEEPVRIIKKVKGGHGGGHHGGAWKVAYADFVTAMMALFIVLWILGQSEETKQAVSSYFRDPGAFEATQGGVMTGSKGLIANAMPPKQVKKSIEAQKEELKKMGEVIKKELQGKGQFAQLKSQITMEMVKEGLRIQLMESSNAYFFDIGTATLKPEAAEILKTIGSELDKMPNHVIVEGHTDARQYESSTGYTNYELSADRANAARRVLVAAGVTNEKIDQVRGFADKELQNVKDPYDVTNRRISIIVKYEGTNPE
ncbi:MAG TPA: flagellar motor protein MotB [Bacteroidota bacterium]|nr:flagellar motor protein MotB [Bacteroidota bacterium]